MLAAATLGAAGCMVGPNYSRPPVTMPATFRDVAPAATAADGVSLADTQWFDVFKDDTLTALVRTAIERNFDIRIAAERVIQARERFHIAESQQYPTVIAAASATSNRRSEVGATTLPANASPQVESVHADIGAAWEVDVWGRLRRMNESARAQYLATEEARRGVLTSLVADVSDRYLQLRSLDAQLAIALRTRDIAADGYRLTDLRRSRGVATALDVRQAEQLQLTAAGRIAALEREIAQTENALSLLLGEVPGGVTRGRALDAFQAPPSIPAGVPASLLTRRPDIRQAEQQLIAANAQIGVARAELFPRITLTGVLGIESRSLSDLLTSRAGLFTAAGGLTAPIFNAGRLRAGVRVAESVQRELVIGYERAIYEALRDVSDALTEYHKTTEQRTAQQALVESLREAVRLSMQRYQGGIDSYLPVLDSQRSLFDSELGLVTLQQRELGSIVELYRALGGGWSETPSP